MGNPKNKMIEPWGRLVSLLFLSFQLLTFAEDDVSGIHGVIGRNPTTGATIKIPAKRVVKFRVAKVAKHAILGPK